MRGAYYFFTKNHRREAVCSSVTEPLLSTQVSVSRPGMPHFLLDQNSMLFKFKYKDRVFMCLKMTVIFQSQVKWVGHRNKSSNVFLPPPPKKLLFLLLQKLLIQTQDARLFGNFSKGCVKIKNTLDQKLEKVYVTTYLLIWLDVTRLRSEHASKNYRGVPLSADSISMVSKIHRYKELPPPHDPSSQHTCKELAKVSRKS